MQFNRRKTSIIIKLYLTVFIHIKPKLILTIKLLVINTPINIYPLHNYLLAFVVRYINLPRF